MSSQHLPVDSAGSKVKAGKIWAFAWLLKLSNNKLMTQGSAKKPLTELETCKQKPLHAQNELLLFPPGGCV